MSGAVRSVSIMVRVAFLVFCGLGFAPMVYAEVPEVMIETVAMESASEPFEGQVAVASVIINRAMASNRPIEAICKAKYQFSAWNDPKWAFSWLSRHYDARTRSKALKAIETALISGNGAITHYHSLDVAPYWARGHKPAKVIGNHAFYDDVR